MADISTDIASWSATAGSNQPQGSTNVGTGLDDNLRAIQAALVLAFSAKGSDLASAATVDLSATNGLFHDVTGTTGITAFGTVRAGIWKVLKFEAALTLTHNASSLIIPGGANITTADGDMCMVTSEGSGNWRVNWYTRAASGAYVIAASDTASGIIEIATQAEQETGTDVVRAVTPGRQQFHPSAAKAWLKMSVAGGTVTVNSSYNISSVTDNGVGDFTANFTVSFADTNYCGVALTEVTLNTDNTARNVQIVSIGTGAFRFVTMSESTKEDNHMYTALVWFGDQ